MVRAEKATDRRTNKQTNKHTYPRQKKQNVHPPPMSRGPLLSAQRRPCGAERWNTSHLPHAHVTSREIAKKPKTFLQENDVPSPLTNPPKLPLRPGWYACYRVYPPLFLFSDKIHTPPYANPYIAVVSTTVPGPKRPG